MTTVAFRHKKLPDNAGRGPQAVVGGGNEAPVDEVGTEEAGARTDGCGGPGGLGLALRLERSGRPLAKRVRGGCAAAAMGRE